ncbi:zinc transporter, ZIP family [Halomonas saccharevitans]|uniref:Zinc transporter, ZIP family n=1 Tax=Halomonas saccharevitans TaxID=416872 RepID=A0A1I7CQS3_9GAMM|nr:zinc transporter, ZIP family [Halomonas saccharevitans]
MPPESPPGGSGGARIDKGSNFLVANGVSHVVDYLVELDPVWQALLATLFTWGVTAAGAALVFFTRTVNPRFMDCMLGFAAGVMIAASFWSLLAPGIDMAEQLGQVAWLTAVIGFMSGGIFMRLADRILPHLHPGLGMDKSEGIKTTWQRSTLLVLAITLHNIPEGLAVGVAFGAVAADLPSATLGGALALAIGIGIQNFPEGTAVAMPLRREGMSKRKSFFMGQASGAVEPIGAVIGALFVLNMQSILPYALCFAAGAMIFVVVEELIPESQRQYENIDLVTMATMAGFTIMMMLDVSLG